MLSIAKGSVSMMVFLGSLEHSAFSTWLRESGTIWAYPTVLTLHTVGLALLVGASWALDLRVLGFGDQIELAAMANSFRVMWIGFWINAVTGLLLFASDATAKGPSRLFHWKLGLIAVGVGTIFLIKRAVYGRGVEEASIGGAAKLLAVASIVIWLAAIAAGRFMAYV
jgi:hypothetical protein